MEKGSFPDGKKPPCLILDGKHEHSAKARRHEVHFTGMNRIDAVSAFSRTSPCA
ncbi:hypothetical protein SAMN05880570_1293 [Paenibacillus sp. RU4T]|nr:hypothetical protein SAMN05880555_1294 [Paenibacillus sp. RU4X]SIQ51548.1 hypothetical protein SAMN05880570_1293 [Paenibacillus sp. RU4T]